ncbi:hypothetical protein G6F56_003302 [Rhizopus delemar]|nr:hypothetical protein G6F56_003302 [Rhizopus delemar]
MLRIFQSYGMPDVPLVFALLLDASLWLIKQCFQVAGGFFLVKGWKRFQTHDKASFFRCMGGVYLFFVNYTCRRSGHWAAYLYNLNLEIQTHLVAA